MGVSADVEMVRPALGEAGVYGVEGAGVPEKWGWRFGLATQFEQAPVLILTEGEVTARPVTRRVGLWAGYSLGVGRGVAVQAVVPLDYQSGDGSELATPGGGVGDPRLGARWAAYDTKLLDATVRADVYLPVGRQDAWLGEGAFRGAVGGTAALNGGFGALLVDLGVTMRPLDTPEPRLDWGPTAEFGVGARIDVNEQLSAGASWIGRAVLAGLATGDGEVASELLASATYGIGDGVTLGGGGGVGTQPGVGVPTFRVFATATVDGGFLQRPPRPEPVAAVEERPPPDPVKLVAEDIPGLEAPPPPPEPPAKVVGDEIVFRGEIKFKEDSAEILPESKDTLVAIANLLAADGRIAHLAIEGHASEEGALAYNWDLSDRRARSVWEALILEGVEPQRMSWRGLGEVSPTATNAGANGRAADRRVVLRIARWLAKDEALDAPPATTLLPWNGEAAALDAVVIPAPEVPPPSDIIDQSFFEEEEE